MDYTYYIEHNTPTIRRPTSLQDDLEMYRGPQVANRIQRRDFKQKCHTAPSEIHEITDILKYEFSLR
jgi:hypothetical protein